MCCPAALIDSTASPRDGADGTHRDLRAFNQQTVVRMLMRQAHHRLCLLLVIGDRVIVRTADHDQCLTTMVCQRDP